MKRETFGSIFAVFLVLVLSLVLIYENVQRTRPGKHYFTILTKPSPELNDKDDTSYWCEVEMLIEHQGKQDTVQMWMVADTEKDLMYLANEASMRYHMARRLQYDQWTHFYNYMTLYQLKMANMGIMVEFDGM